jgi:hypothetical protein
MRSGGRQNQQSLTTWAVDFPSSPPAPPTAPPGPPSSPPGPTSPPLWPTPRVSAERNGRSSLVLEGHNHWSAPALEQAAELAMGELPREYRSADELTPQARAMYWPTPVQEDSQVTGWRPNKEPSGQSLNATAQLWQTPATDSFRSRGGERKDEQGLDQQARGFWPTPNAEGGTGYRSGSNRDTWRPTLEGAANGLQPVLHSPDIQRPAERKRLNPRFVAWLMGLPPGWLDALSSCGPAEMASYRSRLRSHLACLLDESVSTLAAD